MNRVLSQYICVNSTDIRTRTVVEFDTDDTIIALFPLDRENVESANTLFFDGVISGEFSEKDIVPVSSANIFEFIGMHTKPIVVTEKNQLLIWKNLDFLNKKIGEKCRVMALKSIV